jgi:aspartate/methionine/tyrosine aminotransferase
VALPLVLTKLFIRLGVASWLPSVRRQWEGGAAFLRYYSDRVLAAPFPEQDRTAALLERQGPEVIDLGRGVPETELAAPVSGVQTAAARGWPPAGGLPELRAAIAQKLERDNDLVCDPTSEVLVTAGAWGAVQAVCDAFVNRGDRVVLLDPTSPLYPLAVRMRGGRVRWLESWSEDGRTRFRLDVLARVLRGAKMLVLVSPGNPTGGAIVPEDLEQIAWWADRLDVLLVSDEVFERYYYDAEPVSLGTLPRARQRTLTIGSVSKSHGLASLRVGWLAGHRFLTRPCLTSQAARTPFVPALCQQLALATLREREGTLERWHANLTARRRYAWERLRGMGLNPGWPAGAFFFWVPVWERGINGRTFAERLLREKGVRVMPGEHFGPSGPGYVRLGFAVEDGRLREGLNRLGAFLQEMETGKRPEMKEAA